LILHPLFWNRWDSPPFTEHQGKSIWSIDNGNDSRTLYSESTHYRLGDSKEFAIACQDEEWKLVVLPECGVLELYHLSEDPREEENLAESHPAKVRAMTEEAQEYFGVKDLSELLPPPEPPIPDETADFLRRLGYTE